MASSLAGLKTRSWRLLMDPARLDRADSEGEGLIPVMALVTVERSPLWLAAWRLFTKFLWSHRSARERGVAWKWARKEEDRRKEGGSKGQVIKERHHGWEEQAGIQINKGQGVGEQKGGVQKKKIELKKWARKASVIFSPKPSQKEAQLKFFMTLCVDTLDKLTSTKM